MFWLFYDNQRANQLICLSLTSGPACNITSAPQHHILLMAHQTHLCGCLWLFAPKVWEVVGIYKLSFCSKNEYSISIGDNVRWWGHSNQLAGNKNFELYALSGSGDTKSFQFSLAHRSQCQCQLFPQCQHPITSHLVKLSLSNISFSHKNKGQCTSLVTLKPAALRRRNAHSLLEEKTSLSAVQSQIVWVNLPRSFRADTFLHLWLCKQKLIFNKFNIGVFTTDNLVVNFFLHVYCSLSFAQMLRGAVVLNL